MCLWPTDYAEFIESVVSQIKGEGEWGALWGALWGASCAKQKHHAKNMQCQNLNDL